MPLSACTHSYVPLCQSLDRIDTAAHPAFVVGGFIRDSILGRTCRDIDITVQGDPIAIAREFAEAIGGTFFVLKEQHSVARVLVSVRPPTHAAEQSGDVVTIDFVGFDADVESDLARRDFTINSIAVPCSVVAAHMTEHGVALPGIAGQAIDPFGGLDDLADHRIRITSSSVFADDPGRLLRAVRLAMELGFSMDHETETLVSENAWRISEVAAERTREELLKLLSLPCAHDGLHYLDRVGLLTAVFPELEECRAVEQPMCHFWDVLEHSIQTVATFEYIAGASEWQHGNDEMLGYLTDDSGGYIYFENMVSNEASRLTLTKLACLLHDIAKPVTKSLQEDGRARFIGHSNQGADAAREIMQRLRFSTNETTYVETLVYNHLRPFQMSAEGLPSSRAVYRFFRDTKESGIGTLYLAMADYLACRGPLFIMSEWRIVCDLVGFIMEEHRRQQAVIAPSKLIDGNELMRTLGLKPGPKLGVLLESIREAHAAGAISSKEEALELARRATEEEQR
jgi:poly(A) polymerase